MISFTDSNAERISMTEGNDLNYLFEHLDSYHGNLNSIDTLSRYIGVDNMIFVCHGNAECLNLGVGAISIVYRPDYEGQYYNDPPELRKKQRVHINVIDIQACNCANEDSEYGKYNIAYELFANLDVDYLYAWDTECKFSAFFNSNYYTKYHCDGYVEYDSETENRITNIDFQGSIMFGGFIAYVKPRIHSTQSINQD